MIARIFEGYGETVEDPGEIRAALQRGLKAIARASPSAQPLPQSGAAERLS